MTSSGPVRVYAVWYADHPLPPSRGLDLRGFFSRDCAERHRQHYTWPPPEKMAIMTGSFYSHNLFRDRPVAGGYIDLTHVTGISQWRQCAEVTGEEQLLHDTERKMLYGW